MAKAAANQGVVAAELGTTTAAAASLTPTSSSCSRFGQNRSGRGRPRDANDELLGLDNEEEYQPTKKQPRPYPERDCLGLEESFERRCIGEQQLQDHDRADPHRQIFVAEMRPERQGRV